MIAKKIILFLFVFSLSVQVYANAEIARREELIKVIDEEFTEILRLNKQVKSSNPTLLLRLAELLLEKARIIKEKENTEFLRLSVAKRRRIKKRSMFKRSARYFRQAQKICYRILKRFKKFKQIGEVYYVLASNAKEFQDHARAKKYFKIAVAKSKGNKKLKNKTMISLAEIYYNDGQFNEARKLYERALKIGKDKWSTKDMYNLAWCYFKQKRSKKAIKQMLAVIKLSKNGRFIDMRSKAEKDIGFFYATVGRIKDATKYYEKSGKAGNNLLRVGRHLMSYGKYSSAEKVLTKALKYLKGKERVDAQLMLIDLYERFDRKQNLLNIARELLTTSKSIPLTRAQMDKIQRLSKRNAAISQKQAVGKTYTHDKIKRKKKAYLSVGFFTLLADFFPRDAHRNLFNAAETLYSIGHYGSAIDYYDKAEMLASQKGDRKIAKLAQNGLMSSIDQPGIDKNKRKKYVVKVYNKYLEKYPRSKESFKIYQRLFIQYMAKKNIVKAENTLIKFRRLFPKSFGKQEVMLAQIMDYYKNGGDYKGFSKWVTRIRKGEFAVSKVYGKKINTILLTMQFESTEGALSKGDKKKALRGYLDIYKDTRSSKVAKKSAAYNIMLLFKELKDIKRTYGWAIRSIDLMNDNDLVEYSETFLVIAKEMFNRRKFKEAISIYEKTLKKTCDIKMLSKDKYFKNAYILYLAENLIEEARTLINENLTCGIDLKIISEARIDALNSLEKNVRWNSYKDLIRVSERDKKVWPRLIRPLNVLRQEMSRMGRDKEAAKLKNKIIRFYNYSRKKGFKIPIKGLDIVAEIKLRRLQVSMNRLKSTKLAFPATKYNRILKSKFQKLDKLTTYALEVLGVRSGKGLVGTYKILVQGYRYLYEEIKKFSPPGKNPKYVKSFRKDMNGITRPLYGKLKEFKREALKQIKAHNILSGDNKWFMVKELPIEVEVNTLSNIVLMDRGGRK